MSDDDPKHNPGEPEFGEGHGGQPGGLRPPTPGAAQTDHAPGTEPEFGDPERDHDHEHEPADADEAADLAEGHS